MSFLSGLSNIGYVAGGAVKGWNQQQEEQRAREELAMRREEADRRKSEWARQDKYRGDMETAAAPTKMLSGLGTSEADIAGGGLYGLEATPGVTYGSESEAQKALAAYNSPEGTQSRLVGVATRATNFQDAKALQGLETDRLQQGELKRTVKQNDAVQRVMDMQHLPDNEYFVELAKSATAHAPGGKADGKVFGVDFSNPEQPMMAFTVDGKTQMKPATRESVTAAYLQYTSPQAFQAERKFKADAEDKAATRQHQAEVLAENVRFHNMTGKKMDAQIAALGARSALNPLQQAQLDDMLGFRKERTKILGELEAGKIDRRTASDMLEMAGMKFGGGLSLEKDEKPKMTIKEYGELFPPQPGESSSQFMGRFAAANSSGKELKIKGAPESKGSGGLEPTAAKPSAPVPEAGAANVPVSQRPVWVGARGYQISDGTTRASLASALAAQSAIDSQRSLASHGGTYNPYTGE